MKRRRDRALATVVQTDLRLDEAKACAEEAVCDGENAIGEVGRGAVHALALRAWNESFGHFAHGITFDASTMNESSLTATMGEVPSKRYQWIPASADV